MIAQDGREPPERDPCVHLYLVRRFFTAASRETKGCATGERSARQSARYTRRIPRRRGAFVVIIIYWFLIFAGISHLPFVGHVKTPYDDRRLDSLSLGASRSKAHEVGDWNGIFCSSHIATLFLAALFTVVGCWVVSLASTS